MRVSFKMMALACATLLIAGIYSYSAAQSTQGSSTQPAATRVAVCDIVEVFNNYAKADELSLQLETRRQKIQKDSEERTRQIEDLKAEIGALKPGSPQYTDRTEQLWRLQAEQEASQNAESAVIGNWHHEATKQMYDEIIDVVGQVAHQKGYDMVLFHSTEEVKSDTTPELLAQISRRTVLYSAEDLDVTADVIAQLNDEYHKSKQ